MKISVDAGALCSGNKFGTFITTKNILEALGKYDLDNNYTAYVYKRISHQPTAENIKFKILRPSYAWMSLRVSMAEVLHKQDVYLGLSQAIPWFTKSKIISFLHGLSFHYHKDLYPDSYEALKDQIMFATSRANKIIVSSTRVKKELAEQFGYKDSIVLPFGVPYDMQEQGRVKKTAKPYFLFVGMNHHIKNIDFLIKAFTIFKEQQSHKDFELILVGDHQFYEDAKLGVKAIRADRAELRDLYANATGYLSSSLYESFNLPVLEALSQSCSIIGKSSAIVPELREFVTLADELEEFVDAMKVAVSARKIPQRNEVLNLFSWENYANKLISYYSS